uniref:Myb/SANT-like DNA-binding domain-containing protein n=1 Tax=Accipiter nisus TaxID=211598 RepID=A0A8B9N8P7_9AVES
MDFRGKKYERGSNWSDPEVVELLQLWADESVQLELESCLRNQHVFNRIAEVLREKGIHRTGDQCREKIKKMKLEYRRIKDNSKAPRGGRTWKFYEVMDRVLTSRPISARNADGTHPIGEKKKKKIKKKNLHAFWYHLSITRAVCSPHAELYQETLFCHGLRYKPAGETFLAFF